jgi:hypothetical protein
MYVYLACADAGEEEDEKGDSRRANYVWSDVTLDHSPTSTANGKLIK